MIHAVLGMDLSANPALQPPAPLAPRLSPLPALLLQLDPSIPLPLAPQSLDPSFPQSLHQARSLRPIPARIDAKHSHNPEGFTDTWTEFSGGTQLDPGILYSWACGLDRR